MAFDLASIKRKPTMGPPRLTIYGPHGLGKTTILAEAPNPILLPFEDGLGQLEIPAFPMIKTWEDLTSAFSTLVGEAHDFRTIGMDSLDWAEPIVWAETCRRNGWGDIESPGFGKGYIAAQDVWRELLDSLNYLRDAKGMQVLLISHCEVKKFNDPAAEPYDRYQLKLQPRAAGLVQEWSDAVLFLNFRTYTATADAGFNKKVTRGIGTGERVLYTEERPSHNAKNRYGMPPEIVLEKGASYSAIQAAIFPTTTA